MNTLLPSLPLPTSMTFIVCPSTHDDPRGETLCTEMMLHPTSSSQPQRLIRGHTSPKHSEKSCLTSAQPRSHSGPSSSRHDDPLTHASHPDRRNARSSTPCPKRWSACDVWYGRYASWRRSNSGLSRSCPRSFRSMTSCYSSRSAQRLETTQEETAQRYRTGFLQHRERGKRHEHAHIEASSQEA